MDEPGIRYNVDVRDGRGVQVGDGNVLNLHPPRSDVSWPVRVGVLPQPADCYQDRDADEQVLRVLAAGETAVLAPSVTAVLSGLGGVGKTQLAARHARRAWADSAVDLVIWVAAVSRGAVLASYAEAAARLLVSVDHLDAERAAAALMAWLGATRRRWLMVLDDLQDPADLHGLWPLHTETGQLVVTTRRRDAAVARADRRLIEVGVFTPAESVAYLGTKMPAYAGTADLTHLAQDLGHLPLALAQAAAFIADKPLLTVAGYRDRLADRRRVLAEVLPARRELPDEHRDTVAATWSLSIERANAMTPAGLARPLLEIASLLDPAGIPTALFTSSAVTRHLASGIDEASDALGCLNRLSLITLNTAQPARAVRVHALVQRTTRDAITPPRVEVLTHVIADALHEVWPDVEFDSALGQALRSNTSALSTVAGTALWNPRGHPVMFRAGRSLIEAGLARDAESHFRHMRDQALRQLGADHPDTLIVRHDLAHSRGEAGDASGAVAKLAEVLVDRLRVLGPDHPATLTTRHAHAFWRGRAGDASGAVIEFAEVLVDRLRVLGPDHPDTLTTRHSHARWRANSGDAHGAVTELESVLADRLRVLGPDHPSTLVTRHNLAFWRGETEDADGAVTEFELLLADYHRMLGPDHPHTLATRHNLAYWRGRSGDVPGAVRGFESVLADRLRVLGPDHPDTHASHDLLAHWREPDDE